MDRQGSDDESSSTQPNKPAHLFSHRRPPSLFSQEKQIRSSIALLKHITRSQGNIIQDGVHLPTPTGAAPKSMFSAYYPPLPYPILKSQANSDLPDIPILLVSPYRRRDDRSLRALQQIDGLLRPPRNSHRLTTLPPPNIHVHLLRARTHPTRFPHASHPETIPIPESGTGVVLCHRYGG